MGVNSSATGTIRLNAIGNGNSGCSLSPINHPDNGLVIHRVLGAERGASSRRTRYNGETNVEGSLKVVDRYPRKETSRQG
jgi:hypothetical protein